MYIEDKLNKHSINYTGNSNNINGTVVLRLIMIVVLQTPKGDYIKPLIFLHLT